MTTPIEQISYRARMRESELQADLDERFARAAALRGMQQRELRRSCLWTQIGEWSLLAAVWAAAICWFLRKYGVVR